MDSALWNWSPHVQEVGTRLYFAPLLQLLLVWTTFKHLLSAKCLPGNQLLPDEMDLRGAASKTLVNYFETVIWV